MAVSFPRERSTTPRPVAVSVPTSPTSRLTTLTSAFIDAIKWSTDLRFNLSFTFGGFLHEIPARMGLNEALDSAVEAVTDAHSTACCLRNPTPENYVKYSKALKKLKICLDDPVKATSADTLAAIMLLLIAQVRCPKTAISCPLNLSIEHSRSNSRLLYGPWRGGS